MNVSKDLIRLHLFIAQLDAQGYWGMAEEMRKIMNKIIQDNQGE